MVLEGKVVYTGSPHHKRSPGDYNLTPPSAARLTKTLCDSLKEQGLFSRAAAQGLLKEGVRRGLISSSFQGDFPKRIWAVTANGHPVEAMLEDHNRGTYHGYPMDRSDPMTSEVLKQWRAKE